MPLFLYELQKYFFDRLDVNFANGAIDKTMFRSKSLVGAQRTVFRVVAWLENNVDLVSLANDAFSFVAFGDVVLVGFEEFSNILVVSGWILCLVK